MKIERKIEKDGLIVTHFGGLHTYNDAVEALNELDELNKGKKAIYEIVINDDDIELSFSRKEEQLLIEKVETTYTKFSLGALAVVACNDLIFGMSRSLEISIRNELITISVFRSEAHARMWIDEIKELHNHRLHEDRS